jgi:hypothetical protein
MIRQFEPRRGIALDKSFAARAATGPPRIQTANFLVPVLAVRDAVLVLGRCNSLACELHDGSRMFTVLHGRNAGMRCSLRRVLLTRRYNTSNKSLHTFTARGCAAFYCPLPMTLLRRSCYLPSTSYHRLSCRLLCVQDQALVTFNDGADVLAVPSPRPAGTPLVDIVAVSTLRFLGVPVLGA